MAEINANIEIHKSQHISWLRAAVLGANDGIVSVACLLVGVAAAASTKQNLIITGIAGLVGGAMSMAAGEYVSVSSQADTENADLDRESREIENDRDFETNELAAIYVRRGIEPELAELVAIQLMAHDALAAHARDELGITDELSARPLQAAGASAVAFAIGGVIPVIASIVSAKSFGILAIASSSLISLVALGIVSAFVGGANPYRGAVRVGFWGAVAMAVTAGIGHLVGASI
jgi:VIT1/CCC1 family predicted Fe2+/Mn2+ transporter